jgi:DNA-binding Xre family transcriptional regulator
MASKGVIVVVSGEDKTGEVFAAVKKHFEDTQAAAKSTAGSLDGMGKMLLSGLSAAGIAIGFQQIIGGFKEMITSTMEASVQIGKLHQETGIATANLSVLKYAAQASGVEFETVAKAGKKLAESIHDTDTGKLSEGFKILGISAEDVKSKGNDMYGVMELVADKFHTMPDGADKLTASIKLFGKSGQEMIPILNQGAAALEAFKAEAPIFSDEDLQKMETMHKSLTALDGAWKRLSLTVTGTAAPAITAYVNDFSEGIDTIIQRAKEMWHWLQPDSKRPLDDYLAQLHSGAHVESASPANSHAAAPAAGGGGHGGSGGGGGAAAVEAYSLPYEQSALHARFAAIQRGIAEDTAETAAAAKAADDALWAKMAESPMGIFPKAPGATLGAQEPAAPKPADVSKIEGESEKFAHGLFDPLFNLGEKWSQQWKQIRANMLRDLGQAAEGQLFGALFGDSSGSGGKGLDGSKGHKGVEGAGGLVGEGLSSLEGLFHKKSGPVSNGTGTASAGTVLSAAASSLQAGKAGSGAGGVQVILNNNGTPQMVDSTQMSGGQGDFESMVLQVFLKDLNTNGPAAQGIASLHPS